MVEVTEETWEENEVEVIVFDDKKWLIETNVTGQLKKKFTSCHITISFKV